MGFIIAVAALAIVLVPALIVLAISDRMKRRNTPDEEQEYADRKRQVETRKTLIAGVIIFAFAVLFATGNLPRLPRGAIVKFGIVGFVSILLLFVFVFLYARHKFRETNNAIALANAGDSEGALLDIRRAIEVKPESADLWNTLSVLLVVQEDYEEALETLKRAEELGLNESLVATNRALMLWKLSRTEEALQINTIECRRNPANFNAAVNQCHILVDLGLHEEAERQLESIEKQRKSQLVLFPASERKRRRKLFAELHEKVRGGGQSDSSG